MTNPTETGPLEEEIIAIFAELLRQPRVGRLDHFLHLGGNSLIAAQIVARIRSELSAEISLRAFFSDPTPAGVAAALTRAPAVPGQA
ncbi:phosphopantetheine-binding protein [Nonomuraea sp. NPDC049725]|uniref:phosphopantetheine-binding protein n=1 Tax=Nonomuraea sp. NPDC049725 TaxID=3154508 RepID=UPI003445653D